MLNKLSIKNVALIKNLELDFCGSLNILSGETGAGKSIIVDSLMLLLGERYDKTILRFGEEKGYVEGIFMSNDASLVVLDEFGFEREDIIIINRSFNSGGKNEIRINGRLATTAMLKKIAALLVDIYGQNEYQSILKTSEHLNILQYYVRHNSEAIIKNLTESYKQYLIVTKELKTLGNLSERERNIDMLKFQVAEIEKAKIYEGEEEELITRRKIIASAEHIAEELNLAYSCLSDPDSSSAVDMAVTAKKSLERISQFGKEYSELYDRLESVSIELSDIADTLNSVLENIDFDAKESEKTETRFELIRSLKRKYGDYEQMQGFVKFSGELLFKLEHAQEDYEKLQKEKAELVKKIYGYSKELSEVRKNGAKEFEKLIEKELADLGMPGAVFKINFEQFPNLDECENYISAFGMDKVEFYLSANAGQPVKPLTKIISGGEMSRFILALKVISSRIDDIPTMIFDEIDTGISGMIGQEVSKKLAIISRSHQVLCVTHLPQIASMADNHYYINKISNNNETFTEVTLLNENEVIGEISRLSGAKDISGHADENAKQMKNWSNNFKASL